VSFLIYTRNILNTSKIVSLELLVEFWKTTKTQHCFVTHVQKYSNEKLVLKLTQNLFMVTQNRKKACTDTKHLEFSINGINSIYTVTTLKGDHEISYGRNIDFEHLQLVSLKQIIYSY